MTVFEPQTSRALATKPQPLHIYSYILSRCVLPVAVARLYVGVLHAVGCGEVP